MEPDHNLHNRTCTFCSSPVEVALITHVQHRIAKQLIVNNIFDRQKQMI